MFLSLPGRLSGFLLLLLYVLGLIYAGYHFRQDYRRLSVRQWLLTAGLALFSIVTSQLFPLFVFQDPEIVLTLFAAVPFLLAAAILNPAAAMIVGLFTGLGRSLGQTHTLFEIFHFAMAAAVASSLIQQRYMGRIYDWLRQPVISGLLVTTSVTLLQILATFVSADAGGSYVVALDHALFAASADFWTLLIAGGVGGGIVSLVLSGLPHLRPQTVLVPSPGELSLRNRLLSNFVLFAVLLTALLVTIVFKLSVNVSAKLVVNQMAHNAQTVSMEIPEFQTHLQNVLAQYGDNEGLLTGDVAESEKVLKQMHRSDSFYRRILLVDSNQKLTAYYPPEGENQVSLSEFERDAVAKAFLTNSYDIATAESKGEEQVVSFVVPVLDPEGSTRSVLIGRVPQLSLESLIVGLQGAVGQGVGFIVDENHKIIAHSQESKLLTEWTPPANPLDQIETSQTESGIAYRGSQVQDGVRELVFYMSSAEHPWQVVTTVPYAAVLNLALSIGGPLTMVLILVMAIFYGNLAVVGRDITRPVTELVEAAKTIAGGGKWAPSTEIQRSDEIGQLSHAFGQMYRSRNKRLRELSLLLSVSHNVAANIDINQGMLAILRGALRGTGAAGARAVVLNPSGGHPLTFGEGPAAEGMAALDREIMVRVRNSKGLILATPAQMRGVFNINEPELPVSALIAIPLNFDSRFQGVLWLGYRQAHSIDPSAHTLLQTLAGQAAVLAENAHLFAAAEGGRRRLAAVLASTTDAVIVTDQSHRILLINRAMESAFGLKESEAKNRPVSDVIKSEKLVEALTETDDRVYNLELSNNNGRIFYSSAAPIVSPDGQAIGRVAVLHDITHLKQLDQVKSEFVSTVSHDLKSPLTILKGHATMLPMMGDINEKQELYLDKIMKGIDRMSTLVDDLLDLGRIEAGMELNVADVNLQELLSEIKDDYWQQAYYNGIKLNTEVGVTVPVIKAEKEWIRHAIVNLVTNGIKYAPNSGDMVLRAEPINGKVVISLQDKGPGIAREQQMRLFEKFYRVQGDSAQKVEGAGLGLAIVKSIVERHGGRVWCTSQVGQGSIFSIMLPLEPSIPEKTA